MKKILIVLIASILLMSCAPKRLSTPPTAFNLPSNFAYVSDEGNGYFKYQSPDGFYLVSTQVQGQIQAFSSNRFMDIIYIGK